MVSDINRHVGQRMRKYRLAAGMTLQKLSEEIHKSRATVCKYENGEISIDIATMYEICQALQISVGKLTGFDDFSVSVREKELTSSFQVRYPPLSRSCSHPTGGAPTPDHPWLGTPRRWGSPTDPPCPGRP